jgi:LysM repeat protein
MDRSEKKKLPKKLAMLSLPLAVVSPTLADLAANAESQPKVQSDSNSGNLQLASSATSPSRPVTANFPNLQSPARVSSYRVKSGDTISQIAQRFGLSTSKLARLNNLGPNSLIRVGQVLKLSGPVSKPTAVSDYRVKAGDTLSKIAARHNLTVAELVALNRINSSTIIYPGQVLRVAKLVPSAELAEGSPDSYQVAPGDSLKSIAKKFSLTVTKLREYNALSKDSIIFVGQYLSLRPLERPNPNTATTPTPEAADPAPGNSGTDPMRPSGTCVSHGFHVVRAGETITKIAAVYGVSTQSVLTANSLSWTSTIYVGQSILIPGVHSILNCPSITPLNSEMRSGAEAIYRVGKELGLRDYAIVIALATAMQESSLRNIPFGDRDSVGLFQQRPSQGWGTAEQLTNPQYAARAFFGGPSGPNFGKVPGLLDIKNWESMSLSQAAQSVQISAHPSAYQKWELSAWSWLDTISESQPVG